MEDLFPNLWLMMIHQWKCCLNAHPEKTPAWESMIPKILEPNVFPKALGFVGYLSSIVHLIRMRGEAWHWDLQLTLWKI
jgi:hypothetical protein